MQWLKIILQADKAWFHKKITYAGILQLSCSTFRQESDSSCANNTEITEIKTNTITHKKSKLHVSGIKYVDMKKKIKPESKGK